MSQVANQDVGPRRVSLNEYFRIAEESPVRCEYHDGEVVAMAGGSPDHALVTMNVGGTLHRLLRGGPCRAYSADLRIGIPRKTTIVYPDLSVVCGPLQLDPRDRSGQTAINPRVVVEVLSPSTQQYDMTRKFDQYLELESLAEYVLVSQDQPRVQTYYRQPEGGWLFTPHVGTDAVVRLRSLAIDLPLAEAYAGVSFPPEADDADPSVPGE